MSAETENKTDKKTAADEQPLQTYEHIEGERGIYRYKDAADNITYHERPWINGKRTWRALGFGFTAQNSLKLAREEYHRRRTQESAGQNPYPVKAQPEPQPSPTVNSAPPGPNSSRAGETGKEATKGEKLSISGVLIKYRDDGFFDKYLRKREGRTL